MPKSGQCDSIVKPAATLQDGATAECIPLPSSTWKINPEPEVAMRRVHTTSEMTEIYHADPMGGETVPLPACWKE